MLAGWATFVPAIRAGHASLGPLATGLGQRATGCMVVYTCKMTSRAGDLGWL